MNDKHFKDEEERLRHEREHQHINADGETDADKAGKMGGAGGAITGAVAGSALGPVGAVVGAVVGGVAGAAASHAAVKQVDKHDDDHTKTGLPMSKDETPHMPSHLGDPDMHPEHHHPMPGEPGHDPGVMDPRGPKRPLGEDHDGSHPPKLPDGLPIIPPLGDPTTPVTNPAIVESERRNR